MAVGGGFLLNKFLGKTNAVVWTVVSLVSIAEDLLNQYVLGTTVLSVSTPSAPATAAAVAGLGYQVEDGMGAFPREGMGAYPYGGEGY